MKIPGLKSARCAFGNCFLSLVEHGGQNMDLQVGIVRLADGGDGLEQLG
jgi:hypothetical protein